MRKNVCLLFRIKNIEYNAEGCILKLYYKYVVITGNFSAVKNFRYTS